MQIQMTSDYAMRIMVYLASKETVVASTELAETLDIPQKYVLRIGHKLKAANLIDTIAGSKGGYVLLKSPEEISLYDIITVIEGETVLSRPLTEQVHGNGLETTTAVRQILKKAEETLVKKLKSETIVTRVSHMKK